MPEPVDQREDHPFLLYEPGAESAIVRDAEGRIVGLTVEIVDIDGAGSFLIPLEPRP